jgi:hypothetical protein
VIEIAHNSNADFCGSADCHSTQHERQDPALPDEKDGGRGNGISVDNLLRTERRGCGVDEVGDPFEGR